ncbi:unnamed protein product [Microthlaspi erraticum]|uniref:Poor homologous synapsis 1 PH domain-containing protein n=1 Tax=Microthlaspi erraticum TaxID=1685480 RepID=A0A6D2HX50_9BRAS|nr:unnamed protein product [Microthlaspi erraticum]
MAGSLTASTHQQHHRGNAEASEISRWVIGFARFVPYPSVPSPYPGLVHLGKRELKPSPDGTWLSTSSSTVSLQLADDVNRSDVILSVDLGGVVLEEHYISKLNFSWPQMSCVSGFPPRGSRAIFVSYTDSENEMSCVSGFPPRGSRAIFVSYTDSENEIQKFALRFSTCDAAVTFVAALKEKLKGSEEAGNQKSDTRSEISFQSNEIVCRATEEEPNMVRTLE